MKEFDYYIFLDFSENLIGYNIIYKDKIKELMPKINKFRHYKSSKNRKVYLNHIKDAIKRDNIKSYFEKMRIKNIKDNLEIFIEISQFVKLHENCIIFICVDDFQYRAFRKIVDLVDDTKTEIIRESQLKKDSMEYKLSLIIDNLLNIERIHKN